MHANHSVSCVGHDRGLLGARDPYFPRSRAWGRYANTGVRKIRRTRARPMPLPGRLRQQVVVGGTPAVHGRRVGQRADLPERAEGLLVTTAAPSAVPEVGRPAPG